MRKGQILNRKNYRKIPAILVLLAAVAVILKYNLLGEIVSDVLIGLAVITVIICGIIFITYIDTTPTEN